MYQFDFVVEIIKILKDKTQNVLKFSLNISFQDEGYHEKDGQAFCQDCHAKAYAPRCGGCSAPITDNYISSLGNCR